MNKHFTIPDFLSHLPVDERGYPVPYFAAIVNGKPDFRMLDMEKQKICVEYNKCAICGKKLQKGVYYFISGPLGAKNQVSSDPPMHRECAGFSLAACPHLHFEKAERRDRNLPKETQHSGSQLLGKPEAVFMILADKFKTMKDPASKHNVLIKYHAVKIAGYVYQDGILTAVT
jgi:hypothetical protein